VMLMTGWKVYRGRSSPDTDSQPCFSSRSTPNRSTRDVHCY
jgi:hypothetical protein